MSVESRVAVSSDVDIISARRAGRALAAELGFNSADVALIATAISELARNIVLYAQRGELTFERVTKDGRAGICIVASDQGPGIPDISLAMQDGYSTGKSLGLGLPGARRMVDEFDIHSEVGKGTRITLRKYVGRER